MAGSWFIKPWTSARNTNGASVFRLNRLPHPEGQTMTHFYRAIIRMADALYAFAGVK
jgi:hypothetical protein